MGKPRVIAETGAGQHGVATATVCARFGLKCVVYMGAHDVERQSPNVFRMRLLGAEVIPVTSGRGTLKDAMNEALRDWVTNVRDTFYCIGTVAGPHPYPAMVRDFQSIIGKEVREQIMPREGRFPDTLVAAIGGGSNAMGLFYPFLDDKDVRIIGVEAGGKGVDDRMEHCASLSGGRAGVLHGNRTYLLQDEDGQVWRSFDQRGPGLSGHRAGTRLAEGYRPRRICQHHGRRGAWRVPAVLRAGRHHSRAGAQPCAGACHQDRAGPARRPHHRDEHVRPRRQGHLHRRQASGPGPEDLISASAAGCSGPIPASAGASGCAPASG